MHKTIVKMSSQVMQLLPLRLMIRRGIHTSRSLYFFEVDEKGGYKPVNIKPLEKITILSSLFDLKKHIKLAISELREYMNYDPYVDYSFATKILWRFDGSQEMIDNWHVSCDADYSLGHSSVNLSYSPTGSAIFSGYLRTTVVDDGLHLAAGYCNLALNPIYKSFYRQKYLDWSPYNHVVLRVRGDGRCYAINIACKGKKDVSWNDMYNYPMYTRGGPHWQVVKIPFSKFVYTSKGEIGDKQEGIPTDSITSFGITLADKISGPFRLEIDYIAVYCDPNYDEEAAYENYKQP